VFDLIFVGKNPWVNPLQMANLDGKSMVNPENGEPQKGHLWFTDGAHPRGFFCSLTPDMAVMAVARKGNGKGATWPMF
jgi:streptogramin lyase